MGLERMVPLRPPVARSVGRIAGRGEPGVVRSLARMWLPLSVRRPLSRWRAFPRWVRSRTGVKAIILGYHRVADPSGDPFGICVSPRRFSEQMEIVRRHARPVPLGRLAEERGRGEVLERAVAVSFDDGYADVLDEALPILERWEIPATVFPVSGYLGEEPWWDVLARAVKTGMDRGGEPLRLDLSEASFEWSPADGRASVLEALLLHLRSFTEPQRQVALTAILEWAGIQEVDPTAPRILDPEGVRRLVRSGLVEVGAHTVTHPDLTSLDAECQRSEIRGSVARLRDLLGSPPAGFAYPFGRVSSAVASEVEAAGLSWACESRDDVVRRTSDPYLLPRFWPESMAGEHFERWLKRWLGR